MRNQHEGRAVCLLGLLLAGGLACSHFRSTPQPLYRGPAQPPERTALLSGFVDKVDGVSVTDKQGPFTLLPGCHVVEGRANVGNDSPSGAWTADVPRGVFAFRMQAGRSYEVGVKTQGSGSETHNIEMRGIERDGTGKKLAEIGPARTKADVASCLAWAAQQSQGQTDEK